MNRPLSGTLMDPLIHLIAAESSTAAESSALLDGPFGGRDAGHVPRLLCCGAVNTAQPKAGAAIAGPARASGSTGCPGSERSSSVGCRMNHTVRCQLNQTGIVTLFSPGFNLEFVCCSLPIGKG